MQYLEFCFVLFCFNLELTISKIYKSSQWVFYYENTPVSIYKSSQWVFYYENTSVSLVFCAMFCRSLFVLRITVSDCPFGISKPFLHMMLILPQVFL